jgi:ubiquitin C-terminal hydrolase
MTCPTQISNGNSCFINATLQALYALISVRNVVGKLSTGGAQEQQSSSLEDVSSAPRSSGSHLQDRTNDVLVARTFHASTQSPTDEALSPTLIGRMYYNGQQEDAHEFIMRLLDKESAPSLNALLTGDDMSQLQRKACAHVRSTGATDAFTCLSLPVV